MKVAPRTEPECVKGAQVSYTKSGPDFVTYHSCIFSSPKPIPMAPHGLPMTNSWRKNSRSTSWKVVLITWGCRHGLQPHSETALQSVVSGSPLYRASTSWEKTSRHYMGSWVLAGGCLFWEDPGRSLSAKRFGEEACRWTSGRDHYVNTHWRASTTEEAQTSR